MHGEINVWSTKTEKDVRIRCSCWVISEVIDQLPWQTVFVGTVMC